MQTEYEDVLFAKEDGVGVITLNRPEARNAFSAAMRDSIVLILRQVRADPEVRALVLTGAGSAFCAGGDVRSFARTLEAAPASETGWSRPGVELSPYILALRNADQPVIAAVNGPAAGVGISLALACDIRLAADNASFIPAWILRGLIPDGGGNYFLPKLIGASKAFEHFWSGERISAAEAERLGIVSRLLPPDDLMPAALELARRLARMPSVAIALCKHAVYKGIDEGLLSTLEFEAYAQAICFKSEDHAEGTRAFLEKRQPVFRGR